MEKMPRHLPLSRRGPTALYVHVPFCARRCPYCDFATAPLRKDLEERYLQALAREAEERLPQGFSPRTLYLGGGTPAELTSAGIEQLGRILGPYARQAEEVTLEANPRTLLRRKLLQLREALGVGRLSLGAQSFQPRLLRALGRVHRPQDVGRAVALAREVGIESVSVDLIFAVPGQRAQDLRADLREALALKPDHVSLYCLTFEPGTELATQRSRGEVRRPSSGWQGRLFALARRELGRAGFQHYEISNFARPGHRSRHNQVYWRNYPYYGLGNGAASHLRGVRETNHRDLAVYCQALEQRETAVDDREELPPQRKIRETAYLALRTSRGIRRAQFQRDTGADAWEFFAPELARLAELKLLHVSDERIRLTGRGVSLADAVAREIL